MNRQEKAQMGSDEPLTIYWNWEGQMTHGMQPCTGERSCRVAKLRSRPMMMEVTPSSQQSVVQFGRESSFLEAFMRCIMWILWMLVVGELFG